MDGSHINDIWRDRKKSRQGKADIYPSFSAFTVRIGSFTSLLRRPVSALCL